MNKSNFDQIPGSVLSDALTDKKVVGYSHSFYRYPARFSPDFARTIISYFSTPGDTILDPFMGGGTSAVESAILGRRFIGVDISNLATFLATVKTRPVSEENLIRIIEWAGRLKIQTKTRRVKFVQWEAYQKDLPWWIRNFLSNLLAKGKVFETKEQEDLLRCALLRVGQWALESKKRLPYTEELSDRFFVVLKEIIGGMRELNLALGGVNPKTIFLNRTIIGIDREKRIPNSWLPIKLVITSPPYPGVHILYHRWQVRGRRETPAPFWLAGAIDGQGPAYYSFGDRKQIKLRGYFKGIEDSFRSIRPLLDKKSAVVQLISFSRPDWQLPSYLDAMGRAGFRLISDERRNAFWRDVPNRRWYTHLQDRSDAGRELLLVHQPTSD